MMLKPDQERVRTLLRDTITLLCKNGLSFKTKFSIDAVIGVTLDEADAFYVSMNQVVAADKPVLEQDESNSSGDETEALYKQKRKRRGTRHKQSKQIKVEDKQTISIPEDSQHNDMVEQFDDSEGDNSEDASNLSGTFKVEIDESNKDIVFIKQEIEHGESWQETVRGSTSFQASDSNYSGLDASQDGGRNWMQGSQQANLEQSPNTSAALGTSQQLSHVQPVMTPSSRILLPLRLISRKDNPTRRGNADINDYISGSLAACKLKKKVELCFHESKGQVQDGELHCEEVFKGGDASTNQKRKHQSERHKCPECNTTFILKEDMELHVSTVHRHERLACNNCKKSYSSKKSLVRHQREVHGRKSIERYICHHCGKEFRQNRYLNDHIKSTHGKF